MGSIYVIVFSQEWMVKRYNRGKQCDSENVPKLGYNGKKSLNESGHLGGSIMGLKVILRLVANNRL